MAKQRILSIDGGGIRGILPLYALVELEKTHKPARDYFSLMAGTSTGALIITGLAAGVPAKQMLEWYVKDGPDVFQPLGLGEKVVSAVENLAPWLVPHIKQPLDLVADLLVPKYDVQRLHEYVAEKIDGATGRPGMTLNELRDMGKVDLLIPAKGVAQDYAWYFVPDNPANSKPGVPSTGGLAVVDCATASAAAPTYFAPWKIDAFVGKDNRYIGECVDGGVGTAANPAYQACVEALCYTPNGTYTEDQTILVSLGTGRADSVNYHPGDIFGWLQWTIGA